MLDAKSKVLLCTQPIPVEQKQRKHRRFKDLKHKKSDRSTQIFSVYYGHSLECHTGSVDVSGSSPLCSTKENQASKGCLVFYIGKADENRVAVRYRRLENCER